MSPVTLEQRVAALELAMGDATIGPLVGTNNDNLPNGQAKVLKSLYQLHVFADALVGEPSIPGDTGVLGVLKAEIAELAARPQLAPAPAGTPFPTGTQVIDGDIVFTGRVGFGSIDPACKSPLQLRGSDPSIHFTSNVDGSNWQSPKRHEAFISLSNDGGIRQQQNGMMVVEGFTATDPAAGRTYISNNKKFCDSTRPWVNFGPDSRGDWSLTKDMGDGSHEYTQDIVLKIDEDAKEVRWEAYRTGWKWGLAVDARFGPKTFWTPGSFVSRG